MADSRANRNVCGEGGEFFGDGFCGSFPAEGFAGAVVEELGDVAQVALRVLTEVRAFGQELAQKSAGVFVRPSLPGIARQAIAFAIGREGE